MIKLQDVLNEGKKYKKHWSYEAYDSKEEDFFDEVEFQLEKMFPKAKDWEINDYIYSIFDVMSDDEWLNKHSGLNQKAILKHAKRKGLKPIKKPIGEAVNEGIMDTVDSFNDTIKKEIFSIGKKDKKMGIELARLYKKFFIEFSVRMKKLTKDSSLIETKKKDSRGTLRDYKKEYKKYGSSTKSKKYRAELNKCNRQKGTYGNGDGKDASHKGGKIVGFESQSKNRGRAEKSRLKK